MTPQTELHGAGARSIPSREAELRALLDSMNEAPGRVNPNNALIPFAQFDKLHFARLLILDDQTLETCASTAADRLRPIRFISPSSVTSMATRMISWPSWPRSAGDGLRTIFSCCTAISEQTDLFSWMKQHRAPAIANYVNWRGRTVRRIHEEAALREALVRQSIASQWPTERSTVAIREVAAILSDAEQSAGRLTL